MSKRWITDDEQFVFELVNRPGEVGPFDLSDEDLADYDRVVSEFIKWQHRLAKMEDRYLLEERVAKRIINGNWTINNA